MCLCVRDSHETSASSMTAGFLFPPRPWAQRAYFLHAMRGGGLRRGSEPPSRDGRCLLWVLGCRARLHGEGPGQSLRHLLPLYRFLQRSRASQYKLNEL